MFIAKKIKWVLLGFFVIVICMMQFSFVEVQQSEFNRTGLEQYLSSNANTLKYEFIRLRQLVEVANPNRKSLINQLKKCRIQYKKLEGFTGYYFSYSERDLNGPAIPVVEEEPESKFVRPPHGLQVIEEMIFQKEIPKKELTEEVDFVIKLTEKLAQTFTTLRPYEYQLFDILQLRTVKVYTIGVNHFDCQSLKTGHAETIASLNSLKEILKASYAHADFSKLFATIDSTTNFIKEQEKHTGKEKEFDYFTLYKNYFIPLNTQLIAVRNATLKSGAKNIRALNLNARTIFEKDAYNTYFFTKMQLNKSNAYLPLLGKILFFDPILSKDNSVSCSSCHKPELAYTDGMPRAIGFLLHDTLPRNTPTLLNAALQRNLFHDARALVLEDQAKTVVQNEREMHGDFGEVVKKLRQSDEYRKLFAKAFSGTKDTSITEGGILTALAEFQRTLLSFDSRFDKAIRGQENDLSADEINGYNLFMGKAKCGHCHFAGLFNGTTPPLYTESEFDVIGVPAQNKKPYTLDADPGRYSVFKNAELFYAFKTPTIRNTEITGPYMHNGVFKTLEEVIDFYDVGGGVGLGINLPGQTLPSDKLNLTALEKRQLILFIKSLTDTSEVVYFNQPLPAMDDINSPLNSRKSRGY